MKLKVTGYVSCVNLICLLLQKKKLYILNIYCLALLSNVKSCSYCCSHSGEMRALSAKQDSSKTVHLKQLLSDQNTSLLSQT